MGQQLETDAVGVEATMSGSDTTGRVVFLEGRVLRGIYSESADDVRLLLKSGLIEALVRRDLFPRTEVAGTNLPGFELTLEHALIHPFSLQSEWTANMFRDAAIALLETNRIAKQFGYETKDANLHNVTFVGTTPVFFDLGSFQKIDRPGHGWSSYNLFIRDVVRLLVLRNQGGSALFDMLVDYSFQNYLSDEDYVRLRLGAFSRVLSVRAFTFLKRAYAGTLSLSWCSDEVFADRIGKSFWRRHLGSPVLKLLRRSNHSERATADFAGLQRKLHKMAKPKPATVWGGYQDSIFNEKGEPTALAPRYQRILDLLSELKPSSVVEIAGNMGRVSLAIYLKGIAKRVTCTDYDEGAVEAAYELFKHRGNGNCLAARINFAEDNRSIKIPDVASRYKSDAVVALAVTHHLILTQGLQGDLLMKRFADFCDRFALIEFMPWGLWDNINRGPIPSVPSWYTADWFRAHFVKRFDLLKEETVSDNRVVFVGRKRS
jgi:hypothetical protein